jgi:hypothetical protein
MGVKSGRQTIILRTAGLLIFLYDTGFCGLKSTVGRKEAKS